MINRKDIETDVYFWGPIGHHGFRSGYWKYKYKGEPSSIYLSIPHELDLKDQEEILIESIIKHLEKEREQEAKYILTFDLFLQTIKNNGANEEQLQRGFNILLSTILKFDPSRPK